MKKFFILAFTLSFISAAWTSLSASVIYSCNFENASDNDRWTLNPAANQVIESQLVNKWYIGLPGNHSHDGQNGLFISDDGGNTAHYSNSGCWVFAYDTLTLPSSQQDYTITFDYRAVGNQSSWFDGLYLLWIPQNDPDTDEPTKVFSASGVSNIPSVYVNYIIPLQPSNNIDYVASSYTWNQCVARIPKGQCDGTPHYLAFVWANGSYAAQQPGAVIDNIEIYDSPLCDAPYNLVAELNESGISLSWDGIAWEYEVSVYSYETNSWRNPRQTYNNIMTFYNLPTGQTDFIVRAKCGDGQYSKKAILSQLVYYPNEMCVDYLNLSNAVCYVNNSYPTNTLTFDDFRQVSPIDYGSLSIESRHTVHFDRNEMEMRTGGLTHTVPDGAYASVRLGNWNNGAEAERIEFSFVVDTFTFPLLKLMYMPILEAPGHDDFENPRFTMDVFIDGESLDTCARADFNCNDVYVFNQLTPEAEENGWHITDNNVAQTSADIVWKEWTTVGVNLCKPEYEGKIATVRLTTFDCTFSAHSGYAYFTLDCMDNKVKGALKDNNQYEFTAPEGFVYRWYRVLDATSRRAPKNIPEDQILGHDRSFTVSADDENLYAVDCMFIQDSTNYFTLYVSVFSDQPVPVLDYEMDSLNRVDSTYSFFFDASNSYVVTTRFDMPDSVISIRHDLDSVLWNFGDGVMADSYFVNYQFKAPLLRDTTWVVSLTAYYHGHAQTDTVYIEMAPVPNTEGITQIEEDILYVPSIVNAAEQVSVLLQEPSQVRFYNMMGICSTYAVCSAGEVLVTMPSVPGIYVAEILSCSGKRTTQQIIVQ